MGYCINYYYINKIDPKKMRVSFFYGPKIEFVNEKIGGVPTIK
jgi:hypothetical protein